MDYREKAFKEKFRNASKYLDGVPYNIVSLKFRETVSSYSEYHDLLNTLEQEANINYKKLNENFSGTGYLLTDSHSKVIVIEHESGLEILYIAGSIASLIGVIPVIWQYWSKMRNHFIDRHHHGFKEIEIRKIDENGNIKEDRICASEMFNNFLPSSALITAARHLEDDIEKLQEEVKSLSARIRKVEHFNSRCKRKRIINKG